MFKLFSDYHYRFKQFSSNVKWYLLALMLNSIGVGMFQVIYNLYLSELSFNEAFVGKSVSYQALAAVLILLPAGFFSDRLGRRKSMLTGAIFCAFSYIFLGIMETGNIILTLVFLNGLFNAFFMVAQSPFMMENTNPRERIHLFSINSVLMMIGWMFGNIMGGGIPDILLNWFTRLEAMKITVIISGLVISSAILPLLRIKEIVTKEQRGFGEVLRVFREKEEIKTIGKFILPSVLVGFGAGLFVPYTNLYLSSQFSLPTSVIGVVSAVGQITTAVATMIGPLMVKQVGRVKSIFIFQVISLPFLMIMAFTSWPALAILAVLSRVTFMNAVNPLTSNLMMEEVGTNVKGIANSLSQMAFQFGWVVMGPISGAIIASNGYKYVFIMAAIFYLLSALCYYGFFKHLDYREQSQVAM